MGNSFNTLGREVKGIMPSNRKLGYRDVAPLGRNITRNTHLIEGLANRDI